MNPKIPKLQGPQTPPQVGQLTETSQGLVSEGQPLRENILEQVLAAWMSGATPASMTPIQQQRRSRISAQGARTREQAQTRLAGQGLLNSSYGNQVMGDIDRDVAMMLAESDTAGLESLLALGPQLAWAGVPTGISGLSSASGQASALAGQTANIGVQQAGLEAGAQASKNQLLGQIGSTVGAVGMNAIVPGSGSLMQIFQGLGKPRGSITKVGGGGSLAGGGGENG